MLKRAEIGIAGQALGINYLSWVKDSALQLHIKEITVLKDDGSIKIMAEGEERNFEEFIKNLEHYHSYGRIENFYTKPI